MSELLRPVESTRAAPGLVWVRFSDDSTLEIPCPAGLIGNPIAREIEQMRRWTVRPTPPWRPLDAGEHEAALNEVLARIPEPWTSALDIEPGWYPIVVRTVAELDQLLGRAVICQVKQKFGGLRIYAEIEHAHWDAACDIKRAAYDHAKRTCEWCAGHVDPDAELHRRGWAMRLCPDCGEFRDAWELSWREAAM